MLSAFVMYYVVSIKGGATPRVLVVTREFGEDIKKKGGGDVNVAQQTLPLSEQMPLLG